MKFNFMSASRMMAFGLSTAGMVITGTVGADPLVDSWYTTFSARYARIYPTDAAKSSGTASTTWGNGSLTQSSPAYSGVQAIYSSSNWVYIKTTGLGTHVMGPWYLDTAHTQIFPNLPTSQSVTYRIPRSITVLPSHTRTPGGAIGYLADGVAVFDNRDTFSYSNASGRDTTPGGNGSGGTGDGIWNRDAWINEGVSFDPAKAHQPGDGTYHYHATPVALRYLLGDHVNYDPVSKTYTEAGDAPKAHSALLGWMADGSPLYGPYGYSNATNSASGLRLMTSGYVPRDGKNGTTDLATVGRVTLPAWAARANNRSATLTSSETGPAVSATYPIGQYLEDYEYQGDLGKTQGTDFDLDEFNGRWAVTPEFPQGVYAYYVTVNASGSPVFPYIIGRQYHGMPTGGAVNAITETVSTNYVGGPYSTINAAVASQAANSVTLVWNAAEGGTYKVEQTSDFKQWTDAAINVKSSGIVGTATNVPAANPSFFRVVRTGLAAYDEGTGSSSGGGNGIESIMPTSGTRGATMNVKITLSQTAQPGVPPQNAPINSLTIGTIKGTSISRPTRYTINATFTIPSGSATGPQNVTVVFPGPPGNTANTVTYTLSDGFAIE